MSEAPNTRWRSHVNSPTARILEESGYKTYLDFAPVKIRDLLILASVDYFEVENLLTGLYTEANRWREKIDHMPDYDLPEAVVEQEVREICDNAGYFENPEWLVDITVQDFLELEGIDEITIPGMLRELILAAQELSSRPDYIADLYLLPAEVPIHPFDPPQSSYYMDDEDAVLEIDDNILFDPVIEGFPRA